MTPPRLPSVLSRNAVMMPNRAPSHQPIQPPRVIPTKISSFFMLAPDAPRPGVGGLYRTHAELDVPVEAEAQDRAGAESQLRPVRRQRGAGADRPADHGALDGAAAR